MSSKNPNPEDCLRKIKSRTVSQDANRIAERLRAKREAPVAPAPVRIAGAKPGG